MTYRDYEPVDLARAGFKIHQLEGFEKDNIENAFAGFVLEVIGKINDGKEATVYLCRAGEGADFEWAAAKIFKPKNFRHFNTDKSYRNFGKMRDRRQAKHMRGKSERGQLGFHKHWVKSEWQMLTRLQRLGVRVPRPISQYDDGVLMEFIGTAAEGAAPRLINSHLSAEELALTADQLYRDIETMLRDGIVHGDLSPYNVLHDGHGPVIIDVPQATDVSATPEAYAMMQRDLSNLERYFEKQNMEVNFMELLRNLG